MPSLSLFKISEAILAQAKDLLGGGSGDPPARSEDQSCASSPDAVGERDITTLDENFWTTLVGDDRRLADLRRAIEEAAAEAMRTEVDESPPLGESRWEAASRKINDALKAEKP